MSVDVLSVQNEMNWGPYLSLGSFAFFYYSRHLFRNNLPQKVIIQGKVTIWKWVNIANSLLHSAITGIGALICFYYYPRTADDVISYYTHFSFILASFSLGYFFFDTYDMILNHRKRSSYELILHHALVVGCFLLSMITRYYLGFAMVALLIEVNSIFLHWRQLLILSKTSKSEVHYRFLSIINLATFITFRIVPLGWMTRFLVVNRERIPMIAFLLGCVACSGVILMSIVLFSRILQADFHSNAKEREEKNQ